MCTKPREDIGTKRRIGCRGELACVRLERRGVAVAIIYVWTQRNTEKYRETQRNTEKHRETQRNTVCCIGKDFGEGSAVAAALFMCRPPGGTGGTSIAKTL